MCKECGCGLNDGNAKVDDGHGHHDAHGDQGHHEHSHGHGHDHDHHHGATGVEGSRHLVINRSLMEKNQALAHQNRGFFRAKKVLAINVLSSPGSGKTSLIRETALRLKGTLRLGVVVGDLATDNDAVRLREVGIPVVQITTGTVCHLDAGMVARAAEKLDLGQLDVLVIENVGNLVCPADYDLGESVRVVLLSTTEGEDKPLKYPPVFHSASVAVITKMDLADAVGFNRGQAVANLKRISHHARLFELSSRTGSGMDAWVEFIVSASARIAGR